MDKGISPVLATVLLVAIAVIAAVTVWLWISSYTAKPPVSETVQKGYAAVELYKNSSGTGCMSVAIKNVGGNQFSNLIFEVRDYASGAVVGANGTGPTVQLYVNMSGTLGPGSTFTYNFSSLGNSSNRSSVPIGTYFLRPSNTYSSSVSGLSDQIFTCN